MRTFKSLLLALGIQFLSLTSQAAPVTLAFTFDGASFNNGAKASGTITFSDSSLVANPSPLRIMTIGGPDVTGAEISITGANQGNGHFVLGNYDVAYWLSAYTLDLSTELVGQGQAEHQWGVDQTGIYGDFNLYPVDGAPFSGGAPNVIKAASGEQMRLTSMAVVPEPSIGAMFALGLLALMAIRVRLPSKPSPLLPSLTVGSTRTPT